MAVTIEYVETLAALENLQSMFTCELWYKSICKLNQPFIVKKFFLPYSSINYGENLFSIASCTHVFCK